MILKSRKYLCETDLHESVWPRVGTVASLENIKLFFTEDSPGPRCLPDWPLALPHWPSGVSQDGVSIVTRQRLPVGKVTYRAWNTGKQLTILLSKCWPLMYFLCWSNILQGNDSTAEVGANSLRTIESHHPTPPGHARLPTLDRGSCILILMTATALFSSKIHQSMTAVVTPSYDNNWS